MEISNIFAMLCTNTSVENNLEYNWNADVVGNMDVMLYAIGSKIGRIWFKNGCISCHVELYFSNVVDIFAKHNNMCMAIKLECVIVSFQVLQTWIAFKISRGERNFTKMVIMCGSCNMFLKKKLKQK